MTAVILIADTVGLIKSQKKGDPMFKKRHRLQSAPFTLHHLEFGPLAFHLFQIEPNPLQLNFCMSNKKKGEWSSIPISALK